MSTQVAKTRGEQIAIGLHIGITVMALTTAVIHYSLGGMLFLLNALGYLAFVAAYNAPISLASRYRWLIRVGGIGYTLVTLVGWAITGPYFPLAYLTKTIEVLLVAALVTDLVRADGGLAGVLRHVRGTVASIRQNGLAGI